MYDVLIVGYGPVGQLAALLLGRQGHRVAVCERRTEPYPLPRAVHVDDEVLRVLQSAGLADEVAAIVDAPITYEWRNAAGQVLLAFDLTGTGVHCFPTSNMFCQPELEEILDRAVRALPNVMVHRGLTVTGLRETAGHVEISTMDGKTMRAKYVVGCDGAGSTVREHLDTSVTDLGFAHDWLVVDVEPHERRIWDPPALQVCDPSRPTTAVPGGPGRRRFEFMRLPGESPEELRRADTVWTLLAPWGMTPNTCVLRRHAVYTFRAAFADRWRRGRVLLAGDAAHEMPPFAGQGLAAGIRDVANLAWKLDLVLSGQATEAILDTYATERLEHLRLAMAISVELGKVICVLDPQQAARRDENMLAARAAGEQTVSPPPSPGLGAGFTLPGDPLAGQPFPQGLIGADRRRFDDVVFGDTARPGPLMVSLHPQVPPVPGFDVVDIATLGDTAGTYAAWFAQHGRPVVLVRPDRYVFGSAERPDAAGDLARAWTDALAGRGGTVRSTPCHPGGG